MKKLLLLAIFFISIILPPSTFAQGNAFVSIVNPIRGDDFWELKNQTAENAVEGQIAILKKFNLSATWLIRPDALNKQSITGILKERPLDEKGLFLEITPGWTNPAGVEYRKSVSWHVAGSAFLTGYEINEREKLIDAAFEKFKQIFGYYPVSVGAWWIDAYSLGYMQKKYGIMAALIVADQYSTDNYQIWGQYFGTPYYPSKSNALRPAQNQESKLDVVVTQWASRDPVNSFGNGVFESTFSLQANDYIDYHNLDIKYFLKLLDIYSKQQYNKFSHLVVGLENSYEWVKYSNEYQNQIETLAQKLKLKNLSIISMKDFAIWYRSGFPEVSPAQLVVSDDPLGTYKKAVWFMNPYYRAAWFLNSDGSVFRDIRQYVEGEEELCFKARCDSVNFATSATRVLDEVSFGHKWIIDQGKIRDFSVEKKDEEILISYKNEAGNIRRISFLPRDIGIDEKILSIDTTILNALKTEPAKPTTEGILKFDLHWSIFSIVVKFFKLFTFLLLAVFLPGMVFTHKTFKDVPFYFRIFLSIILGLVLLTLAFYATSLLKIKPLIYIYLLINLIAFIKFKIYQDIQLRPSSIKKLPDTAIALVILAGTVFQVTPVFRSGLNFGYGLGFWGPNSHDGVWHLALINQLIHSVPPQNPIFAGEVLKNYHFFYDLLVAATFYLSKVPVLDLVFRFYPVIFSLMLGVGSYFLLTRLFEPKFGNVKTKITAFFSLYLIYFAGSFGWIVEFLRERHLGGESAFWANQAVSFNLNPPFAISLIIVIATFSSLFSIDNIKKYREIVLTIILAGVLIVFKSYGGVLVLSVLLFVGLVKRQLNYLVIFFGSSLISALLFLSNVDIRVNLLIFSPFWFIHSMIDSPDRVGWFRLSLARETGFAQQNWFKFIAAEIISFIIFIAGNLGLRLISLVLLIKIKSIIKDEKLLFIFTVALLSFLIPVLFIQSGNPWNTIQFSYYGIYIAALFGGLVIYLLILKLPKYLKILAIFLIIILAPINSVVTAKGYLIGQPHAFVSFKHLEGLQFLASQPEGIVLTYPYDEKLKTRLKEPWSLFAYDSTAYVSAFSKKAVFLEDEPQNIILLTDYKKRLVASYDFFLKPITESSKFLKDNYIRYIYIQKIFNVRIDENAGFVKNIFENEEIVIYQVNL